MRAHLQSSVSVHCFSVQENRLRTWFFCTLLPETGWKGGFIETSVLIIRAGNSFFCTLEQRTNRLCPACRHDQISFVQGKPPRQAVLCTNLSENTDFRHSCVGLFTNIENETHLCVQMSFVRDGEGELNMWKGRVMKGSTDAQEQLSFAKQPHMDQPHEGLQGPF